MRIETKNKEIIILNPIGLNKPKVKIAGVSYPHMFRRSVEEIKKGKTGLLLEEIRGVSVLVVTKSVLDEQKGKLIFSFYEYTGEGCEATKENLLYAMEFPFYRMEKS
ncbi:hypothetical protein SAMN02745116_01403 [Pilibacter termitis]|uniref:Uncharacterized protein n=1 Tax=Pilibacter termitis TaxID=263852 RepID=A0A1T4NEC3_9ENTE|nr:hypothetical protein [Pilibacter termitis]SJZ77622.1 hypothetical protein SAMN02745116_01403 [Pilibacter termitis]